MPRWPKRTPDMHQLSEIGRMSDNPLEEPLSNLFETLAENLRMGDPRAYQKFQIQFIKLLNHMILAGSISLDSVPKLLLDIEKLKSQDSDGGKRSGGDLLRTSYLETTAK